MRLPLTTLLICFLVFPLLPGDGLPAQAQRVANRAERPVREHQEQSIWMRQKVTASQQILEGLTREDYELIRVNAQAMHFMGYLESWARSDTPGYREQMQSFGFANGALVRAAKDKNLDGATLAYTQLAVSCVQCHKIVRGKTRH
jgi:hypothetical protein